MLVATLIGPTGKARTVDEVQTLARVSRAYLWRELSGCILVDHDIPTGPCPFPYAAPVTETDGKSQ